MVYSQLGVLSLTLSVYNDLQDQLNLGTRSATLGWLVPRERERDAEEGGTLGLQDEKVESLCPEACEVQEAH